MENPNKIKLGKSFDIESINFENEEDYDFYSCPDELRPTILGKFLQYQYKRALDNHFKKTRKVLSQAKYARGLGFSTVVFNNYINGTRFLGKKGLKQLVEIYGNIIYKIAGLPVDNSTQISPLSEEYIELFNKLNNDDQLELLKYAKILIRKSESQIQS